MSSISPAIQRATGRRPSIPTEPVEPPGAVRAVHEGEGPEAARPITTIAEVLERAKRRELIAFAKQGAPPVDDEAEQLAQAVADLNDELARVQ